ncbi:centriolar and ciliogenesis-associated protein HYLS1 [Discoglossus pictus]
MSARESLRQPHLYQPPSDESLYVDMCHFRNPHKEELSGEQSRNAAPNSEQSIDSIPLTVSEEELRAELSLLGFDGVPRHRLLEFKQDLERLMMRGVRGPSGDRRESKEERDPPTTPLSGAASAWDHLSAWASPSSSSSQEWEGPRKPQDPYTKHTVTVASRGLGTRRAAPLTRKVLRKKSDGQTHVSDESSICSEVETDEGDTVTTSAAEPSLPPESWTSHSPDCIKSFIRPPPQSLLNRYRQRSDPVGRYQQYKQSWDALQVALERGRKELRWGIREQMMAPQPQPLPRPLPLPNPYVVPTDKKRYGLRWAIRQDMANGVMPRGNYS